MNEQEMLAFINKATEFKTGNDDNGSYVIYSKITSVTTESKYSKKEYAEMALLTLVNRIIRKTPFMIVPIETNGKLQFEILRCEEIEKIKGIYICEECNEVIKTTFYKVEDAIAELQEYLVSRTNQ